jgi:N-acyl-L-homoserine lactone synthetase/ubiquinone/menaquinone biosynthesis C-methylase UbiE
MPSTIELLREGKTQELWQKCCGFIDLSIWELYAHVHDSLPRYYGTNEKILVDVIVSVGNGTHNGYRILYVGRGTGAFSMELTRKGCNVDNLIISRAVFGGGRLRNNNVRLENVECRGWDIEKGLTQYSDGVFDCVLSVYALYDLRKPDIDISEYFRVLRPSGRLIVVEPQHSIEEYPILKKIYHDSDSPNFRKPLPNRFEVGVCNLQEGKRLRSDGNHYLNEEQLRSKLEASEFRINNIMPADSVNSDLIATAVKPRYYYEANGYRFLSAETREDLEKVFRLRYQVYCVELGVEPENDSGLQDDVYDEYAVHFFALDKDNRPVGTLRALPNNPKGFPMESDFPLLAYMKDRGISRAVEGGRFAIVKSLSAEARAIVGFGLMKGLIDYCKETGINDIFNTTQLKIVKRFAVTGFYQIGEPFEYPGLRGGVLWVPMRCDIREVYDNYSGTVQGYSDLP